MKKSDARKTMLRLDCAADRFELAAACRPRRPASRAGTIYSNVAGAVRLVTLLTPILPSRFRPFALLARQIAAISQNVLASPRPAEAEHTQALNPPRRESRFRKK